MQPTRQVAAACPVHCPRASEPLGHRRAAWTCEVWSVQHLHPEGSGTKPRSRRCKRGWPAHAGGSCLRGVGAVVACPAVDGRSPWNFILWVPGGPSHTHTSDQPCSRDQGEGKKKKPTNNTWQKLGRQSPFLLRHPSTDSCALY